MVPLKLCGGFMVVGRAFSFQEPFERYEDGSHLTTLLQKPTWFLLSNHKEARDILETSEHLCFKYGTSIAEKCV